MNVTGELIQVGNRGKKRNRNKGIIKSNQLPDSVQRVLPEIAVGTNPQGQGESGEAKAEWMEQNQQMLLLNLTYGKADKHFRNSKCQAFTISIKYCLSDVFFNE